MNETLTWFASVLRQPIDHESRLDPSPISLEANHYISPSPTMEPFSRIEIYAQQYWWRLYSILHDQYPMVTRLFGYTGFNKSIATPFILKYPPSHWNINLLGEDLIKWIHTEYKESDYELIEAAVRIDWSYIAAFLGKGSSLPTSEDETLYLSPTTFLFELKWDLFAFRKALSKEDPDWWLTHDFPEIKKGETFYFLLRRTQKGLVAYNRLNLMEFELLKQFQKGLSLNDLCKTAHETAPLKVLIPQWIKHRLITPDHPDPKS